MRSRDVRIFRCDSFDESGDDLEYPHQLLGGTRDSFGVPVRFGCRSYAKRDCVTRFNDTQMETLVSVKRNKETAFNLVPRMAAIFVVACLLLLDIRPISAVFTTGSSVEKRQGLGNERKRRHADNEERRGSLWLVEPLNLVSYKVPEWIRTDFVMQTIFGADGETILSEACRFRLDLRSLYRAACVPVRIRDGS
ncbi:hypothetical protein ANTPLA_LOCUS9924 [Anthophora plagiata]